jgi:uncharacterized protein (DUF433 family)
MFERIELDPRRCGGSPVIRGTRIPVAVIIDHLASGESWDALLQGYPELTADDIHAALLFAKASIENSEIIHATSAGEEQSPTPAEPLLKHAGKTDGLPEDASLNHDHYLYGTPKR